MLRESWDFSGKLAYYNDYGIFQMYLLAVHNGEQIGVCGGYCVLLTNLVLPLAFVGEVC